MNGAARFMRMRSLLCCEILLLAVGVAAFEQATAGQTGNESSRTPDSTMTESVTSSAMSTVDARATGSVTSGSGGGVSSAAGEEGSLVSRSQATATRKFSAKKLGAGHGGSSMQAGKMKAMAGSQLSPTEGGEKLNPAEKSMMATHAGASNRSTLCSEVAGSQTGMQQTRTKGSAAQSARPAACGEDSAVYTLDFPDSTKGTALLSPPDPGTVSPIEGAPTDLNFAFPDFDSIQFLNPTLHAAGVGAGGKRGQQREQELRRSQRKGTIDKVDPADALLRNLLHGDNLGGGQGSLGAKGNNGKSALHPFSLDPFANLDSSSNLDH